MFQKVSPSLKATGPLLPAVMFGKKGEYPTWTGYTLGFAIVNSYRKAHPEVPVTQWMKLDAEDLFAASGYSPCSGARQQSGSPSP